MFLWRFFSKKILHFILSPIIKLLNPHQPKSSSNSKIEIYENLKKNINDNKKKRIKKNGRKNEINSRTKNKSVVIVKKLSLRNDIDVTVKFIVYAGKFKILCVIHYIKYYLY